MKYYFIDERTKRIIIYQDKELNKICDIYKYKTDNDKNDYIQDFCIDCYLVTADYLKYTRILRSLKSMFYVMDFNSDEYNDLFEKIEPIIKDYELKLMREMPFTF